MFNESQNINIVYTLAIGRILNKSPLLAQIQRPVPKTPYVSWSGTLRIGRSGLVPWNLMSLWFKILAANPWGAQLYLL